MARTRADLKAQMNLYKILANKAAKAVETEMQGVRAVDVGQNGGFPYSYRNGENVFLSSTWKYINTNVVIPKVDNKHVSDAVQLGQSNMTDIYKTYVDDLGFKLSRADDQQMQDVQREAEKEIRELVAGYERIYGKITQQQLTEAEMLTKVDFITVHRLAQWAKPNTLELNETNIDNLDEYLASLPPSARPLLPSLSKTLNSMLKVLPYINSLGNARTLIKQLKKNLIPSDGNGGMETDEGYRLGYSLDKTPAQIENDLDEHTASKSFEYTLSATKHSESTATVSASGHQAFLIGWSGLLGIGLNETHYSVKEFSSEFQKIEVTISVKGISAVAVRPTRYDMSNKKGWFYPRALQEAVINDNRDTTGYLLGRYAAEAGEFHNLQGLVIGNFPTVTVKFHQAKKNSRVETLKNSNSFLVTLFGIALVSGESSYCKAEVKEDSSIEGYTITMTPPRKVGSLVDQRALVMGAKVGAPFARRLKKVRQAAETETDLQHFHADIPEQVDSDNTPVYA